MSRSSRSTVTTILHAVLLVSAYVDTSSAQDTGYRLSTGIVPISYVMDIRPNYPSNILDVSGFDGDVDIVARANNDTQSIVLHAGNNITIASVVVTNIDGSINYEVQIQGYNSTTEKLTLATSTTIKSNEIILIAISYSGQITDDARGLFRSTYNITNSTGGKEERLMLATQLENTDARRVFPCFDEPRFKATFQVKLTIPSGFGALSNTEMHPNSTDTEIIFKETTIMSTYLVAFIVYDQATYGPTNVTLGADNVNFTTWCRQEALRDRLADYSQTIANSSLAALEEFTNIPYTSNGKMTKVDLAEVPALTNAMENWGLVTFDVTDLLFSEVNDTEGARERVATTITHELTHQWFGNLVTLDWWSSTWLNEGFAQFFMYYILDKTQPDWRMMDELVLVEQFLVLYYDAIDSGVILTKDVNTPDEIQNQFDFTIYNKGASAVRMLYIALGEENFQAGLQNYLQDRAYKTATPEQLFENVCAQFNETETNVECNDLMVYFNSSGYPVINFERGNTTYNIIQEQFFMVENRSSDNIYPVYMEWFTSEGCENKFWLLSKEASSSDALPTTDDGWYFVRNTGYFRVNYDQQNWKNLYNYLSTQDLDEISPLDRATMVDNILNFASVNYIDYKTALTVTRYLVREVDYPPWAAGLIALRFVHRMLVNTDESGLFIKYFQTLLEPIFNRQGFENVGDHVEKRHRAATIYLSCLVGVEGCRETAASKLLDYLDNGNIIPATLREATYCFGIMNGSANTWERMWQILENTEYPAERGHLINALGCSIDRSTLITYMERILTLNVVQEDEMDDAFSSAYSNPNGTDVVLDYLVANVSQFGSLSDDSILTGIVSGLARYLTKEDQRTKMANLLQNNQESLSSVQNSTLTTIDGNIDWVNEFMDEVDSAVESILTKEKMNQTLW